MNHARKRRRHRISRVLQLKTRQLMLLFASLGVIIYTTISIIFSFVTARYGMPSSIDATLTTEFFGFCKWVVTTGAAITITKTVKGLDARDHTNDFNNIPSDDLDGHSAVG